MLFARPCMSTPLQPPASSTFLAHRTEGEHEVWSNVPAGKVLQAASSQARRGGCRVRRMACLIRHNGMAQQITLPESWKMARTCPVQQASSSIASGHPGGRFPVHWLPHVSRVTVSDGCRAATCSDRMRCHCFCLGSHICCSSRCGCIRLLLKQD